MAVLNTRVKNLDPLTKQVVEYVLNNGSSDAIKIQFAFNIELERVGTILDDCVAKGYLNQKGYFEYEPNLTQDEFDKIFNN